MRGTRIAGLPVFAPGRIIPADAGNTIVLRSRLEFDWDHPRGCGEHEYYCLKPVNTRGSSPRMRGTQRRVYIRQERRWIIPADAGNTPLPSFRP